MNQLSSPSPDDLDERAMPAPAPAQVLPGPPGDSARSGGPGAQLRRAREARQRESSWVAAELRLRPAIIEALERDDYGALPGPVFVAGYLRAYARLLGIDAEPLIEAYRTAHPAEEVAPVPRAAPPPDDEVAARGGLLVPLFSAVVVLALLGGVYLWWQHRELAPAVESGGLDSLNGSPPAALATIPPATPVPDPVSPPPAQPAGPAAPEQAAAAVAGQVPEASLDEVVPAGAVAAPEPPAAPAGPQVVLAFSGPSWVDVRDASGGYRLFGEMAKGDRKVLGGEPPWSLILGNASAVDVTIDGQPYDLTAVARGNVARFRLDPAGAAPTTAPRQD